ncbi:MULTISPECIES: tripartite tricarboxylate transporter TctB family protein [unclassified Mycobacterium]|uniref:tripartite tricarboxylate transporter TctB family protein n=1 Tax=unclassified Mycobacterium TaxID=2642494 RepID=UPI0029C8142D|nr:MULTISPECIES: tripartite tricarboxylate transporter TctB family protein [unclassified Mycobacterium]
MASDTDRPAVSALDDGPVSEPAEPAPDPKPAPDPADVRLTQRVHVALGLVIAALGTWLLYRSLTELAFKGSNGEPGPGYLPALLTIGLIGLGLALSAVWLWGPRAKSGDVPTLSLSRAGMGRAVVVWLALVVCIALIEPFGFLIAGEVLVFLIIVVIERIRSIPSIVALILVPPGMYVLFEILLEVQLPEGTLWR